MLGNPFFLKKFNFEAQWYQDGFRTLISPSLSTGQEDVKSEYDKLKRNIRLMVRQRVLPKEVVFYTDDVDKPYILFKMSWFAMAAILRKYFPGKFNIDISNHGHANDRMRLVHPWRLTNIMGTTQQTLEIRQGLKALKKVDGTFREIKNIELPSDPLSLKGQQSILEQVLAQHQGFIVGEMHQDKTPKQFIMNHAAFLKLQGVNVLFLEHFCDTMQPSLDRFLETGVMPKELEVFADDLNHRTYIPSLKKIEAKQYQAGVQSFDYKGLLYAMQQQGIRMVAIETTYSSAVKSGVYGNHSNRMAVVNHLFKKKLDQTIKSNDDKWVAFVGSAHMTTHYGVPGLSEMTDVPGILVNQQQKQSLKMNLKPIGQKSPSAQLSFTLNQKLNDKSTLLKRRRIKPKESERFIEIRPKSNHKPFSALRLTPLTALFLGMSMGCICFVSLLGLLGAGFASGVGQWGVAIGLSALLTGTLNWGLSKTGLLIGDEQVDASKKQDRPSLSRQDTEILSESLFLEDDVAKIERSPTLILSQSMFEEDKVKSDMPKEESCKQTNKIQS